jgi:hypothetical protein
LEIFNHHLHSDEMLLQHARGKSFSLDPIQQPVRERMWYSSWVRNPERPYSTLREAFQNWSIVDLNVQIEDDDDQGAFCISGSYDCKWGQQNFLLEQLAPVLMNSEVQVLGEDGAHIVWSIRDGVFGQRVYNPSHAASHDE